jgi:hypothetical protein
LTGLAGLACLRLGDLLVVWDFGGATVYTVPPVPRVATSATGPAVPPGESIACAVATQDPINVIASTATFVAVPAALRASLMH